MKAKDTNESWETKMKKRMNKPYLEWKESEDIIERTVYLISYLSPHNIWKGAEAIEYLLAQQRQALKEQVMEAVGSYLEDHAKDTKPWRTYTGTTLKQVIEDIEKRIEAIFEKGEK